MAENKPKEIRHREILDAAARCFAEKGYLGTSIDDICLRAGLTKGGLYWHFKSKRQIIEDLLEYQCARWQGEWDRLNMVEITDTVIYDAGLLFIENNIAAPDKVKLYGMLEAEAARDPSILEMIKASREALLKNITFFSKRVLEFYGNTKTDPDVLARLLEIQISGIIKSFVFFDAEGDPETEWRACYELIKAGIKGKE